MSGAMISITVEDRGVMMLLERVSHICDDMTEANNEAGNYALDKADQHFKDEMGPDKKWDDLKESTKRGRSKGKNASLQGKYQILHDRGNLRISTTPQKGPGNIFRLGKDMVEVGTNIVYAATHQYGDDKSRKAGDIKTRHRMTKGGKMSKQRSNKNLLVFAKKTSPFMLERVFHHDAYTIHIPPRPFLWLDEVDEKNIAEIYGSWCQEKLQGV